ncbi:MAG: hypothetical protein NXI25_18795 [bacterium]|nr:hypothetical protein [bacterium]
MRRKMQKLTALAIGLMFVYCSAAGQGRYVRLQGQILSSLPGAEPTPFHLDAYKITEEGQRQLVRLSRFEGPDYHLYLEAGFDHEVLIQMVDHPPHSVQIKAIRPAPGAADRLVMEKHFIVPIAQGGTTPPIAGRAPSPPGLPEITIRPMPIEAEPPGLLLVWGDTNTVMVPVPGYPEEQVRPLAIAFEEAGLLAGLGHPVEADRQVPQTTFSAPPALPEETVTPMLIQEERLPVADYGPAVAYTPPILADAGQEFQVVETIELAADRGAPEHPGMLQHVADASLPPAPRRARLRNPANMVAGLAGDQQGQSIARLSEGQEIQVIEYTTPDWWMVAHGSVIGWVKSQYLE